MVFTGTVSIVSPTDPVVTPAVSATIMPGPVVTWTVLAIIVIEPVRILAVSFITSTGPVTVVAVSPTLCIDTDTSTSVSAGVQTGPLTIVADTAVEITGPPLHCTSKFVAWLQSLWPLGVRLRNRSCAVVPTGNALTVVFALVVEEISAICGVCPARAAWSPPPPPQTFPQARLREARCRSTTSPRSGCRPTPTSTPPARRGSRRG